MLLAKLNDLKIVTANVGNAYLEAFTCEKLFIVASPGFGSTLKGHVLLIEKALYCLRSSGARWHERADTLCGMGWLPSCADPDVWMMDAGSNWEYICVLIQSKDPMVIVDALKQCYKLKGVGHPEFFLGADIKRVDHPEENVLAMGCQTYVKKCLESVEKMIGEPIKSEIHAPLVPGDHPGLDDSAGINVDKQQQYQSMIGMLQWAVTLGRIDIACAVMTMSCFCVAPREGHFKRVVRIFGFLRTYKKTGIKFLTEIPDSNPQRFGCEPYI